jgi:predicted NACHT family NTPase
MCGPIQISVDSIIEKIFDAIKQRRDERSLQRRYLTYCVNQNEKLGTDWLDVSPEYQLDIGRAFIPVRLTGVNDGRSEDLSSVLNRWDRVVILGQPGAGKSTLTRYITFILAQSKLHPESYEGLSQAHLGCSALLPVRVELKKCNEGKRVEQLLVASGDLAGLVRKHLEEGSALVLFDGLDEVADTRNRFRVMEEIKEQTELLRGEGKPIKFVVTTRFASHEHRTLAAAGFAQYRLQELTPEQQE